MTPQVTHPSEEDLVLLYYSESADVQAVEGHLASCSGCRTEFERLKRVLALVDAEGLNVAAVARPGLEEDVWARLEPQIARQRSWISRLVPRAPHWALAGAAAALVLIAFLAGRFSSPIVSVPPADEVAAGLEERVLVLAVVDHLDRSQMVLLEVLNRDVSDTADLSREQSLARELVASSRLYRQSAVRAGDDRTGAVLDELERVLLEIANASPDATADDLETLRARIAARGLLFKVRVVHTEMIERERQSSLPGSTS